MSHSDEIVKLHEKINSLERRNEELEDKISFIEIERKGFVEEVEKLERRCRPNKVVLIGDEGHYVSQEVYDYIDELKSQANIPDGWCLKKVEDDMTTISITRKSDSSWCGAGIKDYGGAHGLRYEFMDDLINSSEVYSNKYRSQGAVEALRSLKDRLNGAHVQDAPSVKRAVSDVHSAIEIEIEAHTPMFSETNDKE